jgi:glutamate carboxypeptidase
VEQLADFIPRINALRDVPNNITANVGKISGGSATNVVPDSAACEFEMRAARASDIANLEAQVRAFSVRVPGTSFELKVQKVIPPLEESDASRALFEAYSQAAARTGATLEISPRVAGLSDANNLGQHGLPVIDAVGAAGAGAHTNDEYALASSIAAKAAQLVYFLLDQPECQASRAS